MRPVPPSVEPALPTPAGFATDAAQGALASGVAQAVKVGTQLLSVVVLARLLTPRDFGLVAMVAPLIAFLNLIQDLGFSQATIIRKDFDQDVASTAFWINIAIAVIFTAILVFSASSIAGFYNQPDLGLIVQVMAIGVLLAGMTSQHSGIALRELRFVALARVEIVAAVLGLMVGIGWAVSAPSPWAVVWMTLTTSVITMVGAWSASRWRPSRPVFDSKIHSMIRSGGGITIFNVSNFFARNFDNILIGRYLGAGALGLYDRAYKLMLFPLIQFTYPLTRIVIPTLVKVYSDPIRYVAAYRRAVSLMLMGILPGIILIVLMADTVIPLLLGERWKNATPIFRWLGLAALVQPLTVTTGWLLLTQNRTKDYARVGIFNGVTSVAAFAAGLPYGPVGVAAAYAVSDCVLRLPFAFYISLRAGPVGWPDTLRNLQPIGFAAAAAASLLAIMERQLEFLPIVNFVIGAVVSYTSFLAVMAAQSKGRPTVVEAWSIVKRLLKRSRAS